MKITIKATPKEIAALVLELQERRVMTVNQLVLDTIHNATVMENGTVWNATCACDNPVNVEDSRTKD